MGPGWSSEGASGKSPALLILPYDGLNPTVPQKLEGTRIEPPVSLPMASGTMPVASATAEPPLDPPEMRSGAQGLRLVPIASLTEVIPHANSCVWVLPTKIAPAPRARRTASASASGTCAENIGDP